MDEARFGQQGTTTRVWAKRGSRPTAVKQTRYEWLYLYVAVELATGCSVALQAPDVNTGTMNVFLKMLCTQLRADACVRLGGTTDHAVLIMDRAGWHRSKQLAVPDNITILHLPAYSPELNPVERLWAHLRSHHMSNRAYEGYDHLLGATAAAWQELTTDVLKSVCRCDYIPRDPVRRSVSGRSWTRKPGIMPARARNNRHKPHAGSSRRVSMCLSVESRPGILYLRRRCGFDAGLKRVDSRAMPERANHPSSLSAVVISPRSRAGVTLVELVVTIVVMGILAAVAVPRLGKQSTTAKHHCTWASYGIFERAVEMYRADFGGLPADALPGAQPAGMAEYMRTKAWTTPAPLGGRWDWNNDWGTSGAAGSWAVIGPNMSVCEDPAPVVKWLAFDRAIDNNNLATGNLVRLSSKFLAVKHNR